MALIAQAELEQRLNRSLTANEVALFPLVNMALQSYVEDMIGSSLEVTTASLRYYNGGVQHLAIDPCYDITEVTYRDENQLVDDTIDPDDYTTYPANKTIKTQITARFGRFVRGYNNIGVTAKFSIAGDANTVAIIKRSLLELLASEIESNDNINKESIEGYSVEYAKSETRDQLERLAYLFPRII